jgi:hypothetical protein
VRVWQSLCKRVGKPQWFSFWHQIKINLALFKKMGFTYCSAGSPASLQVSPFENTESSATF